MLHLNPKENPPWERVNPDGTQFPARDDICWRCGSEGRVRPYGEDWHPETLCDDCARFMEHWYFPITKGWVPRDGGSPPRYGPISFGEAIQKVRDYAALGGLSYSPLYVDPDGGLESEEWFFVPVAQGNAWNDGPTDDQPLDGGHAIFVAIHNGGAIRHEPMICAFDEIARMRRVAEPPPRG